ncbi:MAG: tryptophan synthase subunit alpha [Zetaproteobacteria bacterium]|nr:MAG: tryptophan synthase subunit alpha [Zetaproteobacteria bacterium]
MTDRIAACFAACRAERRAALVGYLTAGDPDPEVSLTLLSALAEEVDLLEVGIPFSDPMADGPVIQAASERALAAGTRMADLFRLVARVRLARPDLPVVLMGYGNSALAMGMERFTERAAAAGVDGVLLVDIPPEEGGLCDEALRNHGLKRILLLTPTSPEARLRLVAERGGGFVYYVSLTGITGAEMGDVDQVARRVEQISQACALPVCVGFGVKTPQQAAALAQVADGVVVGSRFVGLVADHLDAPEQAVACLRREAAALRRAMARRG